MPSINMNFFDREKAKDFEAIEFRSKRRNLRELEQVGKSNKERDKVRDALMPGKRMSKAGNVYWETRKNRSDSKNSNL
jgi:hypothetical protein